MSTRPSERPHDFVCRIHMFGDGFEVVWVYCCLPKKIFVISSVQCNSVVNTAIWRSNVSVSIFVLLPLAKLKQKKENRWGSPFSLFRCVNLRSLAFLDHFSDKVRSFAVYMPAHQRPLRLWSLRTRTMQGQVGALLRLRLINWACAQYEYNLYPCAIIIAASNRST